MKATSERYRSILIAFAAALMRSSMVETAPTAATIINGEDLRQNDVQLVAEI
jgi:hypothetical protein